MKINKTSLIKAFRKVARPVHAVLKHPVNLSFALLFPFTFKRLTIAMVAHGLLHPIIGMNFFDSADKYLEKNGLDPKIAAELCDDRNIRVRNKDTVLGFAHSALDLPTFLMMPAHVLGMATGNSGFYAMKPYVTFGKTAYITLEGFEDFHLKDQIDAFTGIPVDDIENIPVTREEFYWFAVFHEMRHLDKDNSADEKPFFECDADFYAVEKAVEVFKNENIRDFVKYLRVFGEGKTHETAIYLEKKMDSGDLPPNAAFRAGLIEAEAFMKMYLDVDSDGNVSNTEGDKEKDPYYLRRCEAYYNVLLNHQDEMSDIAFRRAEIYLEAVNYFVPSKMKPEWKAIIGIQDEKNKPASTANRKDPLTYTLNPARLSG